MRNKKEERTEAGQMIDEFVEEHNKNLEDEANRVQTDE